jgi:hypothetical protein
VWYSKLSISYVGGCFCFRYYEKMGLYIYHQGKNEYKEKSEMAELFVTTGDNVAHIVQQGDAWNTEVALKDSHAQCLALDPLHPGTLFVGTFGKGVWKSSDNGRTWHNMNMPQENVFSIAVSPLDGAVYAGCEPSMLFRSEDGGQTWQRIDSGRDRHYTWSLALDPSDPECCFISACPGPREAHNPKGNAQAYIYRWRGNGPWQVLNGGLPQPLKNFPYALASVQGQLFAGLSNGHIYVSHDRGDSWQSLTLTGDALPGILALAYVES